MAMECQTGAMPELGCKLQQNADEWSIQRWNAMEPQPFLILRPMAPWELH